MTHEIRHPPPIARRDGTRGSPRSNVQGRRSEARNPDFGLWTVGLWSNTRDGTRCFTEKCPRNWPSPRPSPARRSPSEADGRGDGSERDGTRPRSGPNDQSLTDLNHEATKITKADRIRWGSRIPWWLGG